MNLQIAVKGIDGLQTYLRSVPKRADAAASQAVSSATRYGFTLGRRQIQEQVAFKTGYLTGSEGGNPRFYISRRPSRTSPIGVVKGRVRATSLYRFVTTQSKRQGVRVRVSRSGGTRRMRSAFIVNLRNGNKGVALRVPKGESVRGKNFAVPYGSKGATQKSNLYLLYGPSVQQVFRDVAPDVAPQVSEYLNSEFQRQLARRL